MVIEEPGRGPVLVQEGEFFVVKGLQIPVEHWALQSRSIRDLDFPPQDWIFAGLNWDQNQLPLVKGSFDGSMHKQVIVRRVHTCS